MDKLILDQAQKIWKEIGQHKTPSDLKLEVELYKKLISIFQVGDYFYLIFNPPEMKIEYCSKSIATMLGYNPEEFSAEVLMQIIHPDDLPFFLAFEARVTDFWKALPPDKVLKYKSRYDYRMRKSNGEYIRLLQQIVCIHSDDEGAVLRTFCVYTDISHLKKSNTMTLSFIGLEGEPSYINVKNKQVLPQQNQVLTRREREVLQFLAQGLNSMDIAEKLYISKVTVDTHRKNMLNKTDTNKTLDLVMLALERGWV
ncbi:MAG: hypothetical protein CL868_02125 [Cytophagaceae bacterium]|nr:hypothetical protein [Cytophagaceae bacterium]|tara:strand:- start:3509 stop:4273 length:765 start_codon:yes stop_codon:yes gene_type:complete